MTANSLIPSISQPPFLSLALFLIFTLFLPLLALRFPFRSFPSLSASLTLGGSSSCLRTDCLVAAGFWRTNKALVSLVGERVSQFSICNHNVLVLSASEGWSYMPLGKDLQIGFVMLMDERCFLQCFLSTFH